MQPLNFSLIFSGTVNPNGGDEEATGIAMQRGELYAGSCRDKGKIHSLPSYPHVL